VIVLSASTLCRFMMHLPCGLGRDLQSRSLDQTCKRARSAMSIGRLPQCHGIGAPVLGGSRWIPLHDRGSSPRQQATLSHTATPRTAWRNPCSMSVGKQRRSGAPRGPRHHDLPRPFLRRWAHRRADRRAGGGRLISTGLSHYQVDHASGLRRASVHRPRPTQRSCWDQNTL
jgi:hypothetical protein